MKKSIVELQSERVTREYLFVQSDLEYKRGIVNEHTQDFMSLVRDGLGDEGLKQPDAPAKRCSSCRVESCNVDEETMKRIKKVYREISKKTHPDRDILGLYTNENLIATQAYEDNDIYTLYQICDAVGISYTVEEGDMVLMQKLIEGMRDELQIIEQSYIWLWYIAINDEMKASLVEAFIKQHRA